jgi:hypothetical protein
MNRLVIDETTDKILGYLMDAALKQEGMKVLSHVNFILNKIKMDSLQAPEMAIPTGELPGNPQEGAE